MQINRANKGKHIKKSIVPKKKRVPRFRKEVIPITIDKIPKDLFYEFIPFDWYERGLTPIDCYIICLYLEGNFQRMSEIYRKIDPLCEEKTSKQITERIINSNKVQKIIKEYYAKERKNYILPRKRRLRDLLFNRALFDISKILDKNGRLKYKSLKRVPEHLRMCIDGIEERYYGKSANVKSVTLKLSNREESIKILSKYLDIFENSETPIVQPESQVRPVEEDTELVDLTQAQKEALAGVIDSLKEKEANHARINECSKDNETPQEGESGQEGLPTPAGSEIPGEDKDQSSIPTV